MLIPNFTNQIIIRQYDQSRFPFRQIFAGFCDDAFGCPEPETLHQYIPRPAELLRVGEDQKTYGLSALYKIDPKFRPTDVEVNCEVTDRGFISTYRNFIRLLESAVFEEGLVYQTLPTLRMQLPDNLSVGEYHRDRKYNHPVEEVNIWIPVTRSTGTATIHIEPASGEGNHRPVEIVPGEFVIFGSDLEHGNEVNREGYTRVSFDFRVIPVSQYREQEGESHNERKRFKIGEYYSLD